MVKFFELVSFSRFWSFIMMSFTVNRFASHRMLCSSVVLSICLCACDHSQNTQSKQQDQSDQSMISAAQPLQDISKTIVKSYQDEGRSLTDVAGQATLPNVVKQDHQDEIKIVKEALSYVGRYHTSMSCKDAFASCDEGSTEFIINLLADGSAHRSFVHLGNVTYENRVTSANQYYPKSTWFYDKAAHEIVVHRETSVKFYYKINEQNNLIMDLDRTLNLNQPNNKYFSKENPLPAQAYVLKKYSDS